MHHPVHSPDGKEKQFGGIDIRNVRAIAASRFGTSTKYVQAGRFNAEHAWPSVTGDHSVLGLGLWTGECRLTSFLGSEHGGQTGNEEPGQAAQRVFEQPEPARWARWGTHSGTATVDVFG
jgi:hypothetical protein